MALLRPSAPSHQYRPVCSLAAVNVHASDTSAPTAPPSGEHQSVWRILFLTLRPGEKCRSIQPEEFVRAWGQQSVKRCPAWTCLLSGVRVSEPIGCSGGDSNMEQDNCKPAPFAFHKCWLTPKVPMDVTIFKPVLDPGPHLRH